MCNNMDNDMCNNMDNMAANGCGPCSNTRASGNNNARAAAQFVEASAAAGDAPGSKTQGSKSGSKTSACTSGRTNKVGHVIQAFQTSIRMKNTRLNHNTGYESSGAEEDMRQQDMRQQDMRASVHPLHASYIYVLCLPAPHPFSSCISFLRISLFSSYVHPCVLSLLEGY
jgi:hypothetical protein